MQEIASDDRVPMLSQEATPPTVASREPPLTPTFGTRSMHGSQREIHKEIKQRYDICNSLIQEARSILIDPK